MILNETILPYRMLNTWKPEIFHGRRKKKNFFEGWYFKIVDRSEKHAYTVIPGVSLPENPSNSHAFVMFLDARAQRMRYFNTHLMSLVRAIKSSSLLLVDLFSALTR